MMLWTLKSTVHVFQHRDIYIYASLSQMFFVPLCVLTHCSSCIKTVPESNTIYIAHSNQPSTVWKKKTELGGCRQQGTFLAIALKYRQVQFSWMDQCYKLGSGIWSAVVRTWKQFEWGLGNLASLRDVLHLFPGQNKWIPQRSRCPSVVKCLGRTVSLWSAQLVASVEDFLPLLVLNPLYLDWSWKVILRLHCSESHRNQNSSNQKKPGNVRNKTRDSKYP